MSAVMACDQCGGIASAEIAQSEWLVLVWATGQGHRDPVSAMFGRSSQPSHTTREFCSLACVGAFASSNAAIADLARERGGRRG